MASLDERLIAISEQMRDLNGPPPLAMCDEVYGLAHEVEELGRSDAEHWKQRAAFERERADAATELLMQWSRALEPPLVGRWHLGAGHVPHPVSRCTDDMCWLPLLMLRGRRGLLRRGWDVDLSMVSPLEVIRFDPEPDESGGA